MTKSELRNSWVNWLVDQNYTHAITLKPNNCLYDPTEHYLRRQLNRFHRNLDRQLLGTRFANEKNGVRRTQVVAVLEGLPHAGHIHGAVKIADGLVDRFNTIVSPENPRNPWTKVVPGGTIHNDTISAAEGWYEYVTKRFINRDSTDNFIFLP